MFFVGGTQRMGKVEVSGGSFVFTEFVHMFLVPIMPLRSYAVCMHESGTGGELVDIPLHGRSILAAYMRAPSVAAIAVSALAIAYGCGVLVPLAVIVASAAVFAYAMLVLGRLDGAERARRAIYASVTGFTCDAAFVTLPEHVEHAKARMLARAQAVNARSYRGQDAPESAWMKLALDESVTDRDFLGAAMTLARMLAAKEKDASRRKELQSAHDAAWKKLGGASR
jgi:hypothetical protein